MTGTRSAVRGVGVNALARTAVLPLSAILGLIVTRLVLDNYGEAAYAQYMLLAGIGALIPFADLGVSAALMNAVASADEPRADRHLRLVLVSCMRILAVSALVLIALSAALTLSGSWGWVLGDGLMAGSGNLAAGLCFGFIALALLVSVGQRIYAGLGKYHVVILMNGLQTPVVLLCVLLVVTLGWDTGGYIAVFAHATTFGIAALTLVTVNRYVAPVVREAFRQARAVRTVRGAKVMDTALPMLVQMVALPLAMQSDRVVLSHVSTLGELAEYSLAAQMFNPVSGVIAAAGMALWPLFAKARADQKVSEVSPGRMSLLFGAVAVALSLVLSGSSGLLAQLATGGRISLDLPLLAAFSCLLVVQATKTPLGMYMTDARGLRFQAVMVVLMLPTNLGLSIVLAREVGAVGPVIGSVVGVLIFQVLANAWYVRRSRARAAEQESASAASV